MTNISQSRKVRGKRPPSRKKPDAIIRPEPKRVKDKRQKVFAASIQQPEPVLDAMIATLGARRPKRRS